MRSDVRKIYFAARRCKGCAADALLSRIMDCKQNKTYVESLSRGANSHARLGALELLFDLAEHTGVDLKKLTLARTENGKPYFEGESSLPHFSISHTGNLVLAALSFDCNIGVDVETAGKYDTERREKIAKRFFSEAEQRLCASSDVNFFKVWTRKEAVSKCFGTGEPYLYDSEASGAWMETFEADGAVISLCAEREFLAENTKVSDGIYIDTENKI